MIYRNQEALYFPIYTAVVAGEASVPTGGYQRESMGSINAAKRRVRTERLVVRRGLPPKTKPTKDFSMRVPGISLL